MQGNIYGLLVKTIKKSPFPPAGRVLTFDKHQLICSSSSEVFEWTAALKHGIRNPETETETETEYGIKYQW